MHARVEVPFPPGPGGPPGARLEPPRVPVEPRWEYKELVRDPGTGRLPTPEELDALGTDGWELAGVVGLEGRVHFYFKRERAR